MRLRARTLATLCGCLAILIAIVPFASGALTVLAQGATPEAGDTALGRNSYTSDAYGYEVVWDRAIWDASLPEVDSEELLLLESAQGSLYIWSGDDYEGDPAACLDGESSYYENDDAAVSDWAPVTNDDGDPIGGSRDGVSYGVYSLTYTDPTDDNAEGIQLVDYLECRTLVEGQAVMFILATSTPANYNDFIRDVFSVTSNITFAQGANDATAVASPAQVEEEVTPAPSPAQVEEASPAATPAASPAPTEVPGTPVTEGDDAGLSGSRYTSSGFGYALEIPSDWTVDNAASEDGTDTLVISNGTSVLTITGTSDVTGDLKDCVDYAYDLVADDPDYEGLKLDETASGDPFEGSDETAAYANYVYTNADGDKSAHFITCQYIEKGASVLFISQDVPYEQYSTQRQARIRIQAAIEFP